jgi:hypothetical protein
MESLLRCNKTQKWACFHSSSVRLSFILYSVFFFSFLNNNSFSFVSTRTTSPTSYLKPFITKFSSLLQWEYKSPLRKRIIHPWPISLSNFNHKWVQFLMWYELLATTLFSANPTATFFFMNKNYTTYFFNSKPYQTSFFLHNTFYQCQSPSYIPWVSRSAVVVWESDFVPNH